MGENNWPLYAGAGLGAFAFGALGALGGLYLGKRYRDSRYGQSSSYQSHSPNIENTDDIYDYLDQR